MKFYIRLFFYNLSRKFVLLIYDKNNECFTWRPPLQIVARSKAWIRGPSLAGIAGSNPAYEMDICLLCVFYVLSGRCHCFGWSLVQRSPTVCDVSENDGEASIMRTPWSTGSCCAMENIEDLCTLVISRRILLRIRNVSYKSCRENQNTYFMFNNFVFRK
jgi:hypothetical protein